MSQKVRTHRRDDPGVRRAQILDETIQLVGQRGYYGFTIRELAQRCGLTNAGLLHYFGSKEELLLAVLQEHDRRATAMVRAVAGPAPRDGGRSDSSLAAVLKRLRAIMSQGQPELARLYTILKSEAMDRDHPAHDHFRARDTTVLDAFAKMVAPHVTEPRATARQLYALMDGLTQQWLRADPAFDLVAEWDRATAILLPTPRLAKSQASSRSKESKSPEKKK
jgi:AcrR family transcriptional regulator